MNLFEDFINNFIELILIMYLWHKFSLKSENNKLKNIVIIVIGSWIAAFFSYININFIFAYIFLVLIISFIYKRNIVKTVLEFCVFLIINMIFQLATIHIAHKLVSINYVNNFENNITIGILNLILVIVIYHLLFNKRKIYIREVQSNVIYCFIINYSLYILISKFIWEYDKNIILKHIFSYILIFILIFLLQLYLYLYVIKIIEEKKELEIAMKYKTIIENITDEIRGRQHDFKNYINVINGLIEVCNENELKYKLKEYIVTVNSSMKNIEDIMYINNNVIKAIIYNKAHEAKKCGVDFLYNIQNNSLENILKDYEISNILNNILNNSFDVVLKKDSNKVVILNIFFENNENIIEIKNNGQPIDPNNFKNIFKKGFSTKIGKKRGYGLYNVKKIVDHNNGKIQLFFEDDFTIFKILF